MKLMRLAAAAALTDEFGSRSSSSNNNKNYGNGKISYKTIKWMMIAVMDIKRYHATDQ